MATPAHPRDPVIRLIALFKLVKALLLVAIALGALSLRRHDGPLEPWLHALLFDPRGRYLHRALEKIAGLDARQLDEIALGSLVYAAVFLVEGGGLVLRKRWAEVLTVVITGSFVPLELYELVAHRGWLKLGVIIANIAIVIYLVRRLRRERRGNAATARTANFVRWS